METMQKVLSACLALSVAGCSAISPKYQLAAEQLEPYPDSTNTSFDGLTNIERVHALVQDSQKKCSVFVNSMFAETAGTNVLLDSLGSVSSALATVFTPLAVTHSLSAASTVLGGIKTSISADYLNTLAIGHVTQAIQSTYSADMQKYITYLDKADPTKIDVVAERSTILSYHNECSLSAAEGSIGSSLQSAPASSTPGASPPSSPALSTLSSRSFSSSSSFPPPPPPPPAPGQSVAPPPPRPPAAVSGAAPSQH